MAAPQLRIEWNLIQNDVEPGICLTEWTLTNTGDEPLNNNGWTIYYCQLSVNPQFTEGDPLRASRISASSQQLTPTASFPALLPGQRRTFLLRYKGAILKENAGPEGAFLVLTDAEGEHAPVSVPINCQPFTGPLQWERGINSWYKYADGELLYEKFLPFTANTPVAERAFLLPRPKVLEWQIAQTATSQSIPAEGYILDVSYGKAKIQAADDAGRYYANKTLARLREAGMPNCHIVDYPDYPYRGFMLDIARNFSRKVDILRLIEWMSDYKLNTLHLHLVDDEAWRLEIPGIPELTEVGSRRGYTTDESQCLNPYYGGGWDADDLTSPANGYLTRADFIEILRFAKDHYIRVVPEIDIPGHSRAAIKSMEARYRKYLYTDPVKATQYLLTDFLRKKVDYNSAQNYTDNVIAINMPTALAFMDKVVSEIHLMYQEAGVAQTYFHLGGDEVPTGVYTDEEQAVFLTSLRNTISRNGFYPGGWEEIAGILPEMKPLSYCWKVSQKKAEELSGNDFPVVLCCANVLYFDHVYVRHQEEKGLYWAGSCELMDTYLFEPLRGANVQGLQAQVFAETIRRFSMVEEYIFPRIFALSERAWNARPESAARYQNHVLTPAEWNASVCKYELPRVNRQGMAFHLSQPGIHVEHNLATMITSVPGATIRYTLDGTDPTEASPVYRNPVRVPKGATVRARAFYLGHRSACTWALPSDGSKQKTENTQQYSGQTY